jgi:hypothetical protein
MFTLNILNSCNKAAGKHSTTPWSCSSTLSFPTGFTGGYSLEAFQASFQTAFQHLFVHVGVRTNGGELS